MEFSTGLAKDILGKVTWVVKPVEDLALLVRAVPWSIHWEALDTKTMPADLKMDLNECSCEANLHIYSKRTSISGVLRLWFIKQARTSACFTFSLWNYAGVWLTVFEAVSLQILWIIEVQKKCFWLWRTAESKKKNWPQFFGCSFFLRYFALG